MAQALSIHENGLFLEIEISPEGDVRLLHFSALPFDAGPGKRQKRWYRLVQIQTSGENKPAHHGVKNAATLPGMRLVYRTHTDARNAAGRKLEITQDDPRTGLQVTSHLQFYDGAAVVRSWTEVRNLGAEPVGLEYVSSFTLAGLAAGGLEPWSRKMRLRLAHNTWAG